MMKTCNSGITSQDLRHMFSASAVRGDRQDRSVSGYTHMKLGLHHTLGWCVTARLSPLEGAVKRG